MAKKNWKSLYTMSRREIKFNMKIKVVMQVDKQVIWRIYFLKRIEEHSYE